MSSLQSNSEASVLSVSGSDAVYQVFRNKYLLTKILKMTRYHCRATHTQPYRYYDLTVEVLCRMGRLDLIRDRILNCPSADHALDFNINSIPEFCKANQDLDLFKLVITHFKDEFRVAEGKLPSNKIKAPYTAVDLPLSPHHSPFLLLGQCLRSGSVDIVRYVAEELGHSFSALTTKELIDSIKAMTLEVLRYVDQECDLVRECLFEFSRKAIQSEKFDLFFYIFRKYTAETSEFYKKEGLFSDAVIAGNLEIVQELVGRKPADAFFHRLNNLSQVTKIKRSHYECVKYLFDKGLLKHNILPLDKVVNSGMIDAFEFAQSFGDIVFVDKYPNLEILIYFYNRMVATSDSNFITFPASTNDTLAIAGKLDCVKFIHENIKEGFTQRAMDSKLEVVQFLLENRSEGFDDSKIQNGYYNDVNIVKLLHETEMTNPRKLQIKFSTKSIDNAAKHGYLDVVKFLYENRTEGFTMNAITSAIHNKHFHVLRYLGDKPIRPMGSQVKVLAHDILRMAHKNYIDALDYLAEDQMSLTPPSHFIHNLIHPTIVTEMSPKTFKWLAKHASPQLLKLPTLLEYAITSNNLQLVKTIMKKFPDTKLPEQSYQGTINTLSNLGFLKMFNYCTNTLPIIPIDENANLSFFLKNYETMKLFERIIGMIEHLKSISKTPFHGFIRIFTILLKEGLYNTLEHLYLIKYWVDIPESFKWTQKLSNKIYSKAKSEMKSEVYNYFSELFVISFPSIYQQKK